MATLADLVGTKSPTGKDSISYLPTLLKKAQNETRDFVFVNNQFNRMGSSALISKDGWKLIEIDRKQDEFQLYDIKNDNEERHNLAAQHPERLSRLKVLFMQQLNAKRSDI